MLLTREEGYLADEQPSISEVEFAEEDLSGPAAQREGDGSRGGVLQILQGHGQREGRRPRLQDARLEETLHFAEDSHALSVAVVAVHLEEEDEGRKRKG